MQKIVVLGSMGMAGHVMAEYLDSFDDFEVIGVARTDGKFVDKQLDVLDFPALEQFLEEAQPDVVVNCIGILVSQSGDEIETAILINSYLPHFLSKVGERIGFKLIHISTDCVFSGEKGGYVEDSFTDGRDNYAKTKALGEVVNNKDLTIRTSIIGPELKDNGTGLLDWFLKQSGEIHGYSKAYWSGVTTLELAKNTREMINQKITGLFQLCPEEKISKFDLLHLIKKISGTDVKINEKADYSVDKSLLNTREDFNFKKPEYESMLQEQKEWMDKRSAYYSIY